MEKRFSEMTEPEIRAEIAALRAKAQRAEQMGMVSEYAVHERKIALAKSYLMDPSKIETGKEYGIQGDPGSTFSVLYLNGIFAWGYKNKQSNLEALPISVLES
ncbi:YfhH family protein [Fictibacillus phosphorivorans]|uniref:YfhH family protein n=1 Tax=Fictibacillus phosphorivorans TaxID=1221500 RepID=UPI00203DB89E|nr:YfhH family protein [Fictibacillus phosphorivorans]MCM3719984.1 YfhH family protein [Fictibacillus phosphorivorans]MCM3777659.1 YfhH family protein [Fictibacillus phosphorivorans]